MQTKQEYIEKEISICEHFKVSAQSRINYFNEEIERFKTLSDEEYEKRITGADLRNCKTIKDLCLFIESI